MQNLIAKKKNELFRYEVTRTTKSLGLRDKSGKCIVGTLAENEILKHDTKSILKTFSQTYQEIYGQNFRSRQIYIIKNLKYLKISN